VVSSSPWSSSYVHCHDVDRYPRRRCRDRAPQRRRRLPHYRLRDPDRERREARAQAREAIRRVEYIARTLRPPHPAITGALDNLETRALIARLPRTLVMLYWDARMRHWAKWATTPPDDDAPLRDPEAITCGRVGSQAADLLVAATWHPWRGAPWRWYRTRRLKHLLEAGMPAHARFHLDARTNRRKWERQVLRDGRKTSTGSAPR
jgi:hypothetical protein